MKAKIVLLPLLAALLVAAGCAKKPVSGGATTDGESSANSQIEPSMISRDALPEVDIGSWKELKGSGYSIAYPPYLKVSDKSSGKAVNVSFSGDSLQGKISSGEIATEEKFVLPVSKINVTLDRQPGTMEMIDSGADLDRAVKASVTAPGGQTYYFQFIFPKSEQDRTQTLAMLETVRQLLNSFRFK